MGTNIQAIAVKPIVQGVCKLCRARAELRKSHVLSDMLYDNVIDPGSHPRMVVVRDVEQGRVSDKTRQTGFRERLLCDKCETQFSGYESYAARHFFNAKLPPPSEGALITMRVNDYAKLKLFFLSLLWRVSVAEGEFFRCVDLGPHEERLREMLIAGNPGEPEDYGCLVTALIPERDASVENVITMPASTRVDGHNGCMLVFRGFVFQYFISRHNISAGVRKAFLNRNGEMLMMWARGGQFPPLRQLWDRCVRAVKREAETEIGSASVSS